MTDLIRPKVNQSGDSLRTAKMLLVSEKNLLDYIAVRHINFLTIFIERKVG
jgi:hypothetical protein